MSTRCWIWFVVALGSLAAVAATPAQPNVGEVTGRVRGAQGESVVYLESVPGGTLPASASPFSIQQLRLPFQPHVSVLAVGATIEFVNSDNVSHIVYWPSVAGDKRLGHNIGNFRPSEQRRFAFERPGLVPVFCSLHRQESGYIVVAPTPFFAITKPDGTYAVREIPYGRYTVWAWHEGSNPQSKSIVVDASSRDLVTDLDFLTEHGSASIAAEKPVELKEGQTPEEVEKALGKPEDITQVKETLIYTYPTVKVIFENGKLVDVQEGKR